MKEGRKEGKDASPEDIFMFLARGTKVRYATMAGRGIGRDPFVAKTAVRRIVSGPGGGQRDPLFVDRRVPNPGIDAREIEEAVHDKNKSEVEKEMQTVIETAAEDSNLIV